MKLKTSLTLGLGIIFLGFTAPVFANNTPLQFNNLKLASKYTNPGNIRPAPGLLCKVCVKWGQGQPGQLFGPCIRYQYQPCGTPQVIR